MLRPQMKREVYTEDDQAEEPSSERMQHTNPPKRNGHGSMSDGDQADWYKVWDLQN